MSNKILVNKRQYAVFINESEKLLLDRLKSLFDDLEIHDRGEFFPSYADILFSLLEKHTDGLTAFGKKNMAEKLQDLSHHFDPEIIFKELGD